MGEITLQDLLVMSDEELQELFMFSGRSIVVTPPTYAKINWDNITEVEQLKILLRFLYKSINSNDIIMLSRLTEEEQLTLQPVLEQII